MNKYFEDFQSLSSIAISGDRQSGKLTFAMYCASQMTQNPVTLISPFSKNFFNKKRQATLQLNSNLQSILERIDQYNLRENWKLLKNKYGYAFLLKDIEKIIGGARELVIIHRVDEFFEIHDANEIENFLFNMITIAQAAEKSLIFTVSTGNNNSHYIYEYFEKNIDSEFVISKRLYDAKARDVELVSSLFSVQHSKFSFELNAKTKQFDLVPNKYGEQDDQESKVYRIILASQSSTLAGVVKYLFDGNNFTLSQVEPHLTEIMNVISDEPQLVIFNPSEHQSIAELKKISKSVKNSNVKVLFISPRSILRRQDKAEILQSGFCDVQEKDFYIEDLILSIERALGVPFYSDEMQKIPNKTYVIYDQGIFQKFIVAFLCKNLFFTVFKFKYEATLSAEDVKKNLGRAFDVALINKEEKLIYLFLVNTMEKNRPAIEAKFSAISENVKMIGSKDAVKYSFDYQNKTK
ncbi:MAG: hypothetical protein KAH20_00175 [Methylococcales bacterium]|nr:hypothetical protein [Methylococcales bacterium]